HDAPMLAVATGKTKVSRNDVLPDGRDVGHASSLGLNANHVRSAGVVVPGVHPAFDENERSRAHNARLPFHLVERALPVGDLQVFAVTQHPDVGTSDMNLLTQIPLQSV